MIGFEFAGDRQTGGRNEAGTKEERPSLLFPRKLQVGEKLQFFWRDGDCPSLGMEASKILR